MKSYIKNRLATFILNRDLKCKTCNRLYYADLYRELYDNILSGKMTPQELIEFQKKLLETVEKLNSEKPCAYFNVENEKHLFRMLVTMALQIYVLGPEPYQLAVLNENLNFKNDIYNSKEISKLINAAYELLQDDSSQYIIITDLCLGNYQFGDLLIKKGNAIIGMEIKSGEKNIKIHESVLKGDANPYDRETERTDWKHFERNQKQWIRGEKILERLKSPYSVDYDRGIVYFPYWIGGIDNYEETFTRILGDAKDHFYNEIKVDEAISIITINTSACRRKKGLFDPPCLKSLLKTLYIKGPLTKDEELKITAFKSEIDDDCIYRFYNNVLYDPGTPQPYLWKASSDTIRCLNETGIEVYIRINFDVLINYLKTHDFVVFSKKKTGIPFLLEHKNKNWIVNYKDCGSLGATPIDYDTIKRITYGMYTTKGLASFLRLSCTIIEHELNI